MPPLVSIIVPCYNEQSTIRLLLDAIHNQTVPAAAMEVILADGMSTDGTRAEIARCQQDLPNLPIRVVDNPRRAIPAALNAAIRAAQGQTIIRLDAHSMPASDYVERCLAALAAGAGDVVGGVWEIRPGKPGWVAQSIAVAAAHPLGAGDALYRFTSRAAIVDTVPFGAFRRSLVEAVGLFDETLLTNEDYEFNARVRLQGGKIWLDPAIRSVYFARSSFGALAHQYFRYGFWKWRMLKRYPATLRWRQALPPLFVLSLLILALAAFFWPVAGWLLIAEILAYLAVLAGGSARAALRSGDARLLAGVPLAVAVMHLSWGGGFLASIVTPVPAEGAR